jgi:hypothetical protein
MAWWLYIVVALGGYLLGSVGAWTTWCLARRKAGVGREVRRVNHPAGRGPNNCF